jgi:hypothetical protein
LNRQTANRRHNQLLPDCRAAGNWFAFAQIRT